MSRSSGNAYQISRIEFPAAALYLLLCNLYPLSVELCGTGNYNKMARGRLQSLSQIQCLGNVAGADGAGDIPGSDGLCEYFGERATQNERHVGSY